MPTGETNKENTFISTAAAKKPVRAVTGSMNTAGSVSAADEVAAVLAARRQRVEEAMQANDKRKEELHQLNGDRKQRDMGKILLVYSSNSRNLVQLITLLRNSKCMT